nr:amino acid adenylation domain-containing protein [uncultured Pseudodesulfovibrio sp.]
MTLSQNTLLIDGFIKNSSLYPDNKALYVDGIEYTYQMLANRIDSTSKRITQLDNHCKLIGVYAYRSIHMYTGILSALHSGNGYVPLNPIFPQSRVLAAIDKSGINIIITDADHLNELLDMLGDQEQEFTIIVLGNLPHLETVAQNITISSLDESELEASAHTHLVSPEVKPSEIAYLLFTSGSTGTPKGVGITHTNAVSMVTNSIQKFSFTSVDSFTQLFDFTFDLSVFDIFIPLTVGGAIFCVPQPEVMLPINFVNKHKISVWFSVPAVAVFLSKFKLLKQESLPHLRLSLFCGETLLETTAQNFAAAAHNSKIFNLYGPTEATVYFTDYEYNPKTPLPADCQGCVPIGTPLPGLDVAVVDETLTPVPTGDIGELCLGGNQLAPGYWKNKTLSDEKFCKLNTNIRKRDNRWYRTGDLVRFDNNCDLIFIGRIDNQIQIAGYRVELGEIEHVLRTGSNVEHLVVVGFQEDPEAPIELIVFYSGSPEIDFEAISNKNLPTYMRAKRYIQVETMPLNSNGKVDRKALVTMMKKNECKRS